MVLFVSIGWNRREGTYFEDCPAADPMTVVVSHDSGSLTLKLGSEQSLCDYILVNVSNKQPNMSCNTVYSVSTAR